MMRILYFSDTYAHEVMGTKRSIYEELVRRGNTVMFQDKKKIEEILGIVGFYKPDQIWLAHSGLVISGDTKKKIKVPVIGFGFSDPNKFTEKRLEAYDAYITNHYETYLSVGKKLPVHYNPTACDFRFHKNLNLEKDIDISFIGLAHHPHFKNKNERIEVINRLWEETDFRIEVWGNGWSTGKIGDQIFLGVINRSKIGLDIQDEGSPLAHRMLEYSACGTPVITRNRPEVEEVFISNEEILVYDSYDDLKEKLVYYLGNVKELNQIGLNARKRCEGEHDIKYRVDKILNFSISLKDLE